MYPTQKPIEIVARPIRYHTKPGELIFEPFSGSGTAFVAPKRKAGGAMAWRCRQPLQPRARGEQALARARNSLDHFNACNSLG